MIDKEMIKSLLSQHELTEIEIMEFQEEEYIGITCTCEKNNVTGIIALQDDRCMFSSEHRVDTNNKPKLLTIVNDFAELYNLRMHVHDDSLVFNGDEYDFVSEYILIELFVDFLQENIKACEQITYLVTSKCNEIILNTKKLLQQISDFEIEDVENDNTLIAKNVHNDGVLQILSTPTSSYEGILTYSIPVKKLEPHMTNFLTSISLDYIFYYQADRLYVKTLHPYGSDILKIFDEIAFLKYFAENLEKCFKTLATSTDAFFEIIENEIKPYSEKLKDECVLF